MKYIFSEFGFRESQVVVKVIVENGGAFIERCPGDSDAFSNVFLSLEDVICELIDLTEELNYKMKVRSRRYPESSRISGHERPGSSLPLIDSFI